MALTLTSNPNILSKISFCDKECSNINDNKTKSLIVELLDKNHKVQIISKDYMILNPNTIRNVSFHQHILSIYSDGNPYLLYLAKIDGVNSAIYIDKKLKTGYTYPKMHCVKYRFDDSLFENETIFTGELIRDSERRWYFLIDNILIYKGMSTSDKNVLGRFELIHNILKNEYTYDPHLEICPLQIKKLFLYKSIRTLCEEFIPTLSYTCKGIVFYTMNNRHSNYAYIIPREAKIPIKSSQEIDNIIEELYPELWGKKQNICTTNSNSNSNSNSNNNDMILCENNLNNSNDSNGSGDDDIPKCSEIPVSSSIGLSINTDKQVQITTNNIVFRILKTDMPDIYNLYYLAGNQPIKHSIALVPNIKISLFLYETFKVNPNALNLNIECTYSAIFGKWSPIRFVNNQPFTLLEVENIEKIVKVG